MLVRLVIVPTSQLYDKRIEVKPYIQIDYDKVQFGNAWRTRTSGTSEKSFRFGAMYKETHFGRIGKKNIRLHGCAYSVGDFIAITKMLAEATTRMLKEGYRVELDELGTFYITLGCEGAESMEDFQPDKHIKELRVNWTPGEAFDNLREGVTFEETLDRRTERKLLRAERKGESTLEL